MDVSTYTLEDLQAMAEEHLDVPGLKRCKHGSKYNIKNEGIAIRIHKNGSVNLVVTAIAECDVGCGYDFNVML